MSKINASLTITRDGVATTTAMKGISYGKLVAVELALSTVQMQMCNWGVGKLAGLDLYPPSRGPWQSDVAVGFDVDFEDGGSSSFSAEYRGLSVSEADEIQALYTTCV